MRRRWLALLVPLAATAAALAGTATGGPGGLTVSISVSSPVEATSASGASVSYSVSTSGGIGPYNESCSPSSGSTFPLGTTSISCSASDSSPVPLTGSDSASVTVQDTTDPSLTVPGDITQQATGPTGANVTFSASASDAVDSSPTVSCSPSSGSLFPVATTTVNCTATDNSGNQASGSFSVTVTPQANSIPTVTVSGPATVEATSAAGAPVSYTATANDAEDGPLQPDCSPASGTVLGIGSHTITCTAQDSRGATASASLNVTVQDTVPPVLSLQGASVNATSSSGAVVSYGASASDAVSGSVPINCSPASGSQFPIGSTTVSCSATDGAGNSAQGSLIVTVNATGSPVVTVPSNVTIEANGPQGSTYSYSASATDDVDGPVAVTCTPLSGSTFPLGETTVTCTARDSVKNVGSASFKITVADRTDPELFVPADLWIQTTESSLPKTDSRIAAFLTGASSDDLVDGDPVFSTNAPATFKAGETIVTFTVTDFSGNSASDTAKVTISPDPPPNTPAQDRTPPKNVSNVKAKVGNKSVTINWSNPADEDFDHVVVTREEATTNRGSGTATTVYEGNGQKVTDKGLRVGTQYRYLIVTFDKAGNHPAGVALVVVGRQQLLFAPADGATVTRPPTLAWARIGNARYYNVQLWFIPGRGAAAEAAMKKVFTAWPKANKLKLKKSWKYSGKRYLLKPGTYRWYVWPGIGPRANNTYGDLLGQSEFVVKKRK